MPETSIVTSIGISFIISDESKGLHEKYPIDFHETFLLGKELIRFRGWSVSKWWNGSHFGFLLQCVE